MQNKLLLCPFCGGEDIYLEKYEHQVGERWRIFCTNCMAQIDRGYDQTKGGVIEAWNTRKPVEKVVSEIRKVNNICDECKHKNCSICRINEIIQIVRKGGVEDATN